MNHSLARHSALYIVARLCPGIFAVAATAALTRLLQPQEYGIYALALVIMTLGSSACFDWLNLSLLRFYETRRGDPKLVSTFVSIFAVITLLSALGFGGLWITGAFAGRSTGIAIIGLMLVWTSSWFEFVSRLAVAEFQPLNYLLMSFGRSVFTLLGACGGAWLTGSPAWAALGTGLGSFAGTFFVRVPVPLPSIRRFDRDLGREILRFGAPMAVSMIVGTMISSGSRLLVEELDSASALGLFTAASILAQNTLAVIGAGVASAGYPLAVRAMERGDTETVRRQLSANGTLLLAILAPASLGLALTGNCLATTLVGSKFTSGVATLVPWIAANTFFVAIQSNYLDHAFQLGLRPHLQVVVLLCSAGIAISLCFYEIPREGPLGAAIALTVSAAVGCALSAILGRRGYPLPLPIASGARIAAASALMALVVIMLPDSGWAGLTLRVGIGAIVYVLAALALNVANVRAHLIGHVQRANLRLNAETDEEPDTPVAMSLPARPQERQPQPPFAA